MKDKSDINRIEGKGFLSNYPVGTYRLLYDKNCYCLLIYSNVFLQIQNDQNTLRLVPWLWKIVDKMYWHYILSHQHFLL